MRRDGNARPESPNDPRFASARASQVADLVRLTGNSEYLAVYDALDTGVQRSDMWRYVARAGVLCKSFSMPRGILVTPVVRLERYTALYLHGGVYADVDVVAKPPMADLLNALPDDLNRAPRPEPIAPTPMRWTSVLRVTRISIRVVGRLRCGVRRVAPVALAHRLYRTLPLRHGHGLFLPTHRDMPTGGADAH